MMMMVILGANLGQGYDFDPVNAAEELGEMGEREAEAVHYAILSMLKARMHNIIRCSLVPSVQNHLAVARKLSSKWKAEARAFVIRNS